ncbi:MAG: hypothetical protein M3O30_17050 [Planctomycetota bacterium]|nr:hypothetical protein [Planctomycetota bacterium]
MLTPTTPFHLHATTTPTSAVDAPVAPTDHLPSQIAGQPAAYFWKEMIHTGAYTHPTRGYSLAVDQARLQLWAQTGEKMLARGVPIPINCDHSDRARDVVGYVKQFRLEGNRLKALCQFIGTEAALIAARNLVSVGIDPNFTDGQARQWGEAIVHLALTPVPVVPDQGQFIAASREGESELLILSSADDPQPETLLMKIPCTDNQWQTLQGLLPDASTLRHENCIDRVIEHLQRPPAITTEPEKPAEDVHAELNTTRQKLLELSAQFPAPLSDEAQSILIEAATERFNTAVTKGGLSPAARDRLVATLIRNDQGRINTLALSRAGNLQGDRALALTIADILNDNHPQTPGETTSLQALTRQIPGEAITSAEDLKHYMTKVASV